MSTRLRMAVVASRTEDHAHHTRTLVQAGQRVLLEKSLAGGGIGRVFKAVSALEDPLPPPDGYQSPGLLADMAVHNLDEVIWLTGLRPLSVLGTGARLYNQLVSRVPEDFDDAFLQVWLAGDAVAQVVVSRNHVAGYRNEALLYGTEGHVHVGQPFAVRHREGQRALEVALAGARSLGTIWPGPGGEASEACAW